MEAWGVSGSGSGGWRNAHTQGGVAVCQHALAMPVFVCFATVNKTSLLHSHVNVM
jgi:hypothetical protein